MRAALKRLARLAGLHVQRLESTASQTLLGLPRFPIRSIVDVGASEGVYSRALAARFPAARLYCVEPLDRPFERLAGWAAAQGGRALTFKVALGADTGPRRMHRHVDHDYSSSILATTGTSHALYPQTRRQEPTIVQQTTLDDLIARLDHPLAPEILIKLDVQGYEAQVIAGGRRTFAAARAAIVEISLDRLYEGQPSFIEMVGIFAELGMDYAGNIEQFLAKDGHAVFVDACFVRP